MFSFYLTLEDCKYYKRKSKFKDNISFYLTLEDCKSSQGRT